MNFNVNLSTFVKNLSNGSWIKFFVSEMLNCAT